MLRPTTRVLFRLVSLIGELHAQLAVAEPFASAMDGPVRRSGGWAN
jgi:hypothetical protein